MNHDQELRDLSKPFIKDIANYKIKKLAGDISSRAYFKLQYDDQRYIACLTQKDSKKQNEDFIYWRNIYAQNSLPVPKVYHYEKGFILQEYLGKETFLSFLSNIERNNLKSSYQEVLDFMLKIHSIEKDQGYHYDMLDSDRFRREVNYSYKYLLNEYLGFTKDVSEEVSEHLNLLLDKMDHSVEVVCHRDYHSKNIMVGLNTHKYIIDFQDSMLGSPLYDLASLLNDCYTNLSTSLKQELLEYYLNKSEKLSIYSKKDLEYQFDLYSLQRVFKALGNFSAVWSHNQNPYYLRYIAFGMEKIRSITIKYKEMQKFQRSLFKNYYGN